MAKSGSLWGMFKDFHSGRELQDEQGRKGYIIAARSQELESLKAPTYLVKWEGDLLATSLDSEKATSYMRDRFVVKGWASALILAAQKASWRYPDLKHFLWAEGITDSNPRAQVKPVLSCKRKPGGAPATSSGRQQASAGPYVTPAYKKKRLQLNAQPSVERTCNRPVLLEMKLQVAEGSSKWPSITVMDPQTVCQPQISVMKAAKEARRRRKETIKVPENTSRNVSSRPCSPIRSSASALQKSGMQGSAYCQVEAVLRASTTTTSSTPDKVVAVQGKDKQIPDECLWTQSVLEQGEEENLWVTGWNGRRYLKSMCYKEGDIRVEDIKPEDLSGDFDVDYILDEFDAGPRNLIFLVKWKGYELNIGNGKDMKGDWEPAKNVAGTAALREWKKIKKEII
jgi:hypothetical protein